MKLIQIAHRGEAQEFIKYLKLKPNPIMDGLYCNSNTALIITGEGIFEVFSKLPYLISSLAPTALINMGIAGSLDKKIKAGEIYKIRTSYAHDGSEVKFKSFTSTDETLIDCITTEKRVLNNEHAKLVSPFAQIVDRELWALARIAKTYSLPFHSYKLISDIAGNETDCFDIKDKAQEFSQILVEYYLDQNDMKSTALTSFVPPFKMSFSNRIRYEKLMMALSSNDKSNEQNILSSVDFEKINESKLKDKEKAKELLNALELKLNPIQSVINAEIDLLFKPFKDIGCQIKVDPKLESKKFNLTLEVNSQTNLDNLKRSIDLFKYNKLEKIWNGDFNV